MGINNLMNNLKLKFIILNINYSKLRRLEEHTIEGEVYTNPNSTANIF